MEFLRLCEILSGVIVLQPDGKYLILILCGIHQTKLHLKKNSFLKLMDCTVYVTVTYSRGYNFFSMTDYKVHVEGSHVTLTVPVP